MGGGRKGRGRMEGGRMGELWGLNRESSFLKLGSDWLIHDHQPGTGNQADFHGLLFIFYLH